MTTKTETSRKWDELKSRVREHWTEITDSDLAKVRGKMDQLILLIEEKTGTTRREIEEVLDNTMKSGESIVRFAADKVRNYASQASDVVKGRYDFVNQQVEVGLEDAQDAIRSRPGMSVGFAFGVGVVTGALLSMLVRSDRR